MARRKGPARCACTFGGKYAIMMKNRGSLGRCSGRKEKGGAAVENGTNKRIAYIDVFRGMGILYMVLGHIGFSETFTIYIQSFHMPMFFLVTGLFYKKQPAAEALRKRCRTLMLPYFLFACFFLAVVCAASRQILWNKVSAVFLYPTEFIPLSGAMWFIVALFISNVLYLLIDLIPARGVRLAVILCCALFGELFGGLTGIVLPFALGPAMVGVGLIHIGVCAKPFMSRLAELKPLWVVVLGAVGAAIGVWEGYVSMRTDSYPMISMFWVAAVINSVFYLNLARMLQSRFPSGIFTEWLGGMGRDSMVYLIFNQPAIKVVNAAASLLSLPGMAAKGLVVVGVFVGLYIAERIFSLPPLRPLMGK